MNVWVTIDVPSNDETVPSAACAAAGARAQMSATADAARTRDRVRIRELLLLQQRTRYAGVPAWADH
jgi:hypothetical protein